MDKEYAVFIMSSILKITKGKNLARIVQQCFKHFDEMVLKKNGSKLIENCIKAHSLDISDDASRLINKIVNKVVYLAPYT